VCEKAILIAPPFTPAQPVEHLARAQEHEHVAEAIACPRLPVGSVVEFPLVASPSLLACTAAAKQEYTCASALHSILAFEHYPQPQWRIVVAINIKQLP